MDFILQVGVKVFLQNSEGQYLVLRRSSKKYSDVITDVWDIPGGRINPGTPLLDNLKREILEETSLDLVEEPQLIAAQDIMRAAGRHVVRLTYLGSIDGSVKLDLEESEEFKWLNVDELREMGESLDRYARVLLNNLTR